MAIEAERSCGFRKVGAIYLSGAGWMSPCDRLPINLEVCKTCGQGLRVTRMPMRIDAFGLFGDHYIVIPLANEGPDADSELCKEAQDDEHPCPACRTSAMKSAYLLGVGREYTPASFVEEARKLGVSKRIWAIPRDFKVGESWILLTHRDAGTKTFEKHEWEGEIPHCIHCDATWYPDQSEEQKGKCVRKWPAIFYAFRPERVELLIWKSEDTPEKIEDLEKRNIRPIIVPDGDQDHMPAKHKAKLPKLKEPPKPKGQTPDEFTRTLG